MNEKENVLVAKQFFEATAKGDLPSVQELMAENVDWQSPVTRVEREQVSWSKPRQGRKEIGAFFKDLFEKVQPEKLEPLELPLKLIELLSKDEIVVWQEPQVALTSMSG